MSLGLSPYLLKHVWHITLPFPPHALQINRPPYVMYIPSPQFGHGTALVHLADKEYNLILCIWKLTLSRRLIQLYCSQERSGMINQDSHLLVIQRSTLEWSTGGNTLYCQRHCSDTPKTQARKKLSPPQFSSRQICCRGLILLVHLANPLFLAHSFKPANPLQPMTPSSQQICHRQFIPLSPVSPTQAEHFCEPSHISFVANA